MHEALSEAEEKLADKGGENGEAQKLVDALQLEFRRKSKRRSAELPAKRSV